MADNDLLTGWKEIAEYLKVTTKTARRWEMSNDLPILRPDKRRKGPVFATKRALDGWVEGTLATLVLEDDRLVALGLSDRILWMHRFPSRLRKYPTGELAWRVQRIDFHGTGDQGALVTVGYVDFERPDAIHYFSSAGRLEWTLEADPALLDRNGNPFEKAWAFRHTVTARVANGYAAWAAVANDAGWAGCIMHVNGRGTAAVHLANAGHVERLCYVGSENRAFLIACGENNDFDQAFVALVAIDGPSSVSPPGGRPRYRYKNAPAGFPLKYILFPSTELVVARMAPYGHAKAMRKFQDHIIVEVDTAGEGGYLLYHFSETLEPRYVFPSGSHEFAHRELELVGKIDHSWNTCHEMDQPLVLNVWNPIAGWHNEPIRWRDNPWRDK